MIRRQPINEVGILWCSRAWVWMGDDLAPGVDILAPWTELECVVPSVVDWRRGLLLDAFLYGGRHVVGFVKCRRGGWEIRHVALWYRNNGDISRLPAHAIPIYRLF